MRSLFLLIAFLSVSATLLFSQKLTMNDLLVLEGKDWKGELTYLDYQSGEKVSIPVELSVLSLNNTTIELGLRFPEEPHANSKERIKLGKNGKTFDKHEIISKKDLPDGTIEVITLTRGKDDNKKADMKYTYYIQESSFSYKKEVRYNPDEEYFFRNEFKFSRPSSGQ